eukprot:1155640-Pelagomonas_calceolata.AAC.2
MRKASQATLKNWRSLLTQRCHWYAVPEATTGPSCSRPCLAHAYMHAGCAPCKLLLPFLAYLLLPGTCSRPYTRGSLIHTLKSGMQVMLLIASANFRAFTSLFTLQLTPL